MPHRSIAACQQAACKHSALDPDPARDRRQPANSAGLHEEHAGPPDRCIGEKEVHCDGQADCIWQLGAGAMPSAASQLVSSLYAGAAASGSNLRANRGQPAWCAGSQAAAAAAGQRSLGSASACRNISRTRLCRGHGHGSALLDGDRTQMLEAAKASAGTSCACIGGALAAFRARTAFSPSMG